MITVFHKTNPLGEQLRASEVLPSSMEKLRSRQLAKLINRRPYLTHSGLLFSITAEACHR